MALEPKDRDRLEKLLNMLGSPNDGEIGNAGRMIQRMAERYNVTPATLCLGNPQPPQSERPYPQGHSPSDDLNGFRHKNRTEYGTSWNASGGRSWGDSRRTWQQQEEQRQREEQAAERQRQREARDARFHEERQEELRREGERRAREQAKKDSRVRKHFGSYFGLLARLKAIYEEQFNGLENWQLDFIEIVLAECKADRQMTTRQRDMAKALIKHNEQAEPLV